jgi:hypothetical protein
MGQVAAGFDRKEKTGRRALRQASKGLAQPVEELLISTVSNW